MSKVKKKETNKKVDGDATAKMQDGAKFFDVYVHEAETNEYLGLEQYHEVD